MNPSPLDRYKARRDELDSLKVEFQAPKRPGDQAPLAARFLEAAGDLLRRSTSTGTPASTVEQALTSLPQEALASWVVAVRVTEVGERLSRACTQAVEAALPDSDEDGRTLAGWAMQDLLARDRLESSLVALQRLGAGGRADAAAAHDRIRLELQLVDRRARQQVLSLCALNGERRLEASLLDAPFRDPAWWLTERSGIEDDALIQVLGGAAKGSLGEKERAADALVREPRQRRVTFDELFRLDLELATPAERALIAAHVERDADLTLAMAAMREGERAIEELTAVAPTSSLSGSTARASVPTGEAPEVVEAHKEFKVLVFRTRERVRVTVQPRRADRFAAAAVFLPEAPSRSLPSLPSSDGIQFDLGTPATLRGLSARVVVNLTNGEVCSAEIRL